jgi:hypothetical protein
MRRLPKLKNAERTKNPKGGAINFLVACLAPGPCTNACIKARTAFRRYFGVADTMVGGKLSDPQAGSRRCFGTKSESARRPKDSQSKDRLGGSQRPRDAFGFLPREEGE